MSRVKIEGNASGTGTFTIAAPNGSTDRTLTLPDEAGTVLTSGGAIDVDASAPADSIAIDSSGNVGIGTSSMTYKLNIEDGSGGWLYFTRSGGPTYKTNASGSAVYSGTVNNYPWIFQTNSTERMRIDSSGNLLVGTTSGSDSKVYAVQSDYTKHGLWVENTSGTVNFNTRLMNMKCSGAGAEVPYINFYGGATFLGRIRSNSSSNGMDYTTASDYRLKENVKPISGALNLAKQLNPISFNFKSNPHITVQGFLAHEVQSIVPESVGGTKDAVDDDGNPIYQDLDSNKLIPLLTAALQEAVAKIEALETRIAALEA